MLLLSLRSSLKTFAPHPISPVPSSKTANVDVLVLHEGTDNSLNLVGWDGKLEAVLPSVSTAGQPAAFHAGKSGVEAVHEVDRGEVNSRGHNGLGSGSGGGALDSNQTQRLLHVLHAHVLTSVDLHLLLEVGHVLVLASAVDNHVNVTLRQGGSGVETIDGKKACQEIR